MTEVADEFEQWLEAQSRERIMVAYERAQRRDTEHWDDASFQEVLMYEVYSLYVADMTRDLADRGLVDTHVLDDGQLGYTLTEAGKEAIDGK